MKFLYLVSELPYFFHIRVRGCDLENLSAADKIFSESKETSSGSITTKVFGEQILFKPYEVNYKRKTGNKYNAYPFIDESERTLFLRGYAFFSVATFTDENSGEKMYRRASAYFVESVVKEKNGNVLEEIPVDATEKNVIHFMKTAPNDLSYKKTNNPDRK